MSHCIVLLKQVPDVSRIGDDAFDPETGNLMRNRLPAVLNELDVQALSFAARIRSLSGGSGRIIAVTMGPPAATSSAETASSTAKKPPECQWSPTSLASSP